MALGKKTFNAGGNKKMTIISLLVLTIILTLIFLLVIGIVAFMFEVHNKDDQYTCYHCGSHDVIDLGEGSFGDDSNEWYCNYCNKEITLLGMIRSEKNNKENKK